MKKLLFLLLVGLAFQVQAQNFLSQYDQLVSVNQQWKYQPDVNPSLKTTAAKPLSEQQLVEFHLQQVEMLLRSRNTAHLSVTQQKQRAVNLNTLHSYLINGVFPINTMHQARQPYFIDKYNTYCAVGYLMKMSGADKMAREIHDSQNFSYLFDIKHPQLQEWAKNSGFTLSELALIQPTYGGEMPPVLMEMHYNNTGTDVNEYIEIKQGNYTVNFNQILFYNQSSSLYKTLLISQMQTFAGGYYYYTFPSNESFADAGYIEIRSSSSLVSTITYNSSSVVCTGSVANLFANSTLTYSLGESETTPLNNSLSFAGFWGTSSWNLTAGANSMATINPGVQFPTPITLSKFDYTLTNKQITLNWETVSEINNKYFSIEKSNDGVNFYEIGKVNGAGTSNSVKQYSFTDSKPAYINQYRLKQVDFDGKSTYSKIVYVKVQQAASILLMQNMVSSQLQVLVQNEAKGSINIYDFSGKLVKQVQALSGKQTIDVSTLSSGSYLLSWKPNSGEAVNLVFQKVN